mmetsp:Transcript_4003/g.10037  ORF Transcript_4003/g.10037 Transcript_4003/m.10037 type:complete len:528 (-) Transcript_4003:862-2445(-)
MRRRLPELGYQLSDSALLQECQRHFDSLEPHQSFCRGLVVNASLGRQRALEHTLPLQELGEPRRNVVDLRVLGALPLLGGRPVRLVGLGSLVIALDGQLALLLLLSLRPTRFLPLRAFLLCGLASRSGRTRRGIAPSILRAPPHLPRLLAYLFLLLPLLALPLRLALLVVRRLALRVPLALRFLHVLLSRHVYRLLQSLLIFLPLPFLLLCFQLVHPRHKLLHFALDLCQLGELGLVLLRHLVLKGIQLLQFLLRLAFFLHLHPPPLHLLELLLALTDQHLHLEPLLSRRGEFVQHLFHRLSTAAAAAAALRTRLFRLARLLPRFLAHPLRLRLPVRLSERLELRLIPLLIRGGLREVRLALLVRELLPLLAGQLGGLRRIPTAARCAELIAEEHVRIHVLLRLARGHALRLQRGLAGLLLLARLAARLAASFPPLAAARYREACFLLVVAALLLLSLGEVGIFRLVVRLELSGRLLVLVLVLVTPCHHGDLGLARRRGVRRLRLGLRLLRRRLDDIPLCGRRRLLV